MNVQISEKLGGLEGEAVYIDTEGSFIAERVIEIIDGTANRLAALEPSAQHQHQQEISVEQRAKELEGFTVDNVLSRIHYFRVHDYVEEIALLNVLEDFVRDHPKVKLVVIDSIAFHFRYDFSDIALRTRLLNGMAQGLMRLAEESQLAVVLMNQMTTKIQAGEAYQDQSILTPALGESWGHACTSRVNLFWQDAQRHAQLFKSPSQKEQVVRYQIGRDGIQDVDDAASGKRKRAAPIVTEKHKKS